MPGPLVYMDQSPNFTRVGDCARSTLRHNEMDTDFPAATIARLRRSGVMVAPLPRSEGGLGWGTENDGALPLSDALQAIGYGSLAAGRIYEAHVNAIALIFQYGNEQIKSCAATAVRDGHLFALWVAPSAKPVRAFRCGAKLQVTGRKAFCTAAGVATWAVITAEDENNNERMILIDANENKVDSKSTVALHGMKSTSTKAMTIDCEVPAEFCFGNAGDYLHEPDFSAGAWRTSAVTVGGLQALVDETIRQLRARDRHANPHQAARIGQMLIKSHTAAMWIGSVVREAIPHYDNSQHLIGYVNLARLAIEQACLDVIPLVQRSLGMTSLTVNNPVEAMMRDLVTYLRQPAADEILTDAAITFAQTTNPTSLGAIS
jgi:alkylation response protein AidB-like acyl-CoA dehydrogenase